VQSGNAVMCLFLSDSLAYVGSWPSPIINVRDPAHPTTVGSFPLPLGGIFVRDTLAYLACDYDTFYVYSVADPTQPVRSGGLTWLVASSTASTTPASKSSIRLLHRRLATQDREHRRPGTPREIGTRWNHLLPTWRADYAAPYLYAACAEGGVCILDTLTTAVEEPPASRAEKSITVVPSVTNGLVSVFVSPSVRLATSQSTMFKAAELQRLRKQSASAVLTLPFTQMAYTSSGQERQKEK